MPDLTGFVFAALAACCAWFALVPWWRARAARGWPTVEGEMLSSRIEERVWRRRRYYRLHVEYTYAVDGVAHTGRRWWLLDRQFAFRADAEAVRDQLASGARVRVFVDPAHPERACLEPRVDTRSVKWLLVGAAISGTLALGALVIALGS